MAQQQLSSDTTKELKLRLQKDKRYIRLKNSFATLPMFNINVDDLLDEVMNLNSLRQVKSLNAINSPDFIERVIKAAINDQAIRSRLAEILSEGLRIRRTVETALDSFVDYCLTVYSENMPGYRSKTDKENLIKLYVSSHYGYLDKMATLQTVVQTIIEDIDKSHWTLKNIVEALKLIHVPERKLQ